MASGDAVIRLAAVASTARMRSNVTPPTWLRAPPTPPSSPPPPATASRRPLRMRRRYPRVVLRPNPFLPVSGDPEAHLLACPRAVLLGKRIPCERRRYPREMGEVPAAHDEMARGMELEEKETARL